MTQNEFRKIPLEKIIAIAFVMLFIVSCTIQRRQHLRGFYVERWHFGKSHGQLSPDEPETLIVAGPVIPAKSDLEEIGLQTSSLTCTETGKARNTPVVAS